MATADIIKVWKTDDMAYAAFSVAEGGNVGTVEFVVSTPLKDASGNNKGNVVLKADLVAACKAKRNDDRATDSPGVSVPISGTVTV